MKYSSRKSYKVVSILLALFVSLMPHVTAYAAPPRADVAKIRIEITDQGLNGNPGEVDVEVEQGQQVEMTFVWAHKEKTNEEHIMKLDGYKLETDKLDSSHKEATIKFIADKTGSFDFYCDIECEVHDALQRGVLKVKGTGGGSAGSNAVARTATNLAVSASSSLVATGESVTLMTTLTDPQGKPISKAEIHYFVDADFAGQQDKMEVGTAKTDANGVAFFDYQPTEPVAKQTITAAFQAQGIYDDSQKAVEIQLVGAPLPAYQMAPIGLEDFRDLAPLALGLGVLGLWSVFAFVLIQAVSIARDTKRR